MTPYLTNSEADLYFESRFQSIEWDMETEQNKTKALSFATRLINMLNFCGDKTDKDQENEFPRDEETTIPIAIKDACCEIAYALIRGADVDFDAASLSVASVTMSVTRFSADPSLPDLAKIHNIPSAIAWGLLRPYLRDGSVITISRVD